LLSRQALKEEKEALEAQKRAADDTLRIIETQRQTILAMKLQQKQQQEEEAEVMARARQIEVQRLQEASDALEATVRAAVAEGVAKDRLEQSVKASQDRLALLQKHNDTLMAQAAAMERKAKLNAASQVEENNEFSKQKKSRRDDPDDKDRGAGGQSGRSNYTQPQHSQGGLAAGRAPPKTTNSGGGSSSSHRNRDGSFKAGPKGDASSSDSDKDEDIDTSYYTVADADSTVNSSHTTAADESFTLEVDGVMVTFPFVTKVFRDNFATMQTVNRETMRQTIYNRPLNTTYKKGFSRPLVGQNGQPLMFTLTPATVSVAAIRDWMEEAFNYLRGHTTLTAIGYFMNYTSVADPQLREFVKSAFLSNRYKPGDGTTLTFPGFEYSNESDDVQRAILTFVLNAWLFVIFKPLYRKDDQEDIQLLVKAKMRALRLDTPSYASWQFTRLRLEMMRAELGLDCGSHVEAIKVIIKNTVVHFKCPELGHIFEAALPRTETGSDSERAKVLLDILAHLAVRHQSDMACVVEVKKELAKDTVRAGESSQHPQRDREFSRDRDRDRDAWSRERFDHGDRRQMAAIQDDEDDAYAEDGIITYANKGRNSNSDFYSDSDSHSDSDEERESRYLYVAKSQGHDPSSIY
jgi:hypothetical protein